MVEAVSVREPGTGERSERLDHTFAVSVAGRGHGTSLASGLFICRKRYEAGFQGLQAHEKKIRLQRIPSWFQTFVFACHGFLFRLVSFCLVSFGLVWTRTGVE